jgi:hypothetical protein
MSSNINDITYDVNGGVLYDGEPYTGEVVETTKDGAVIAKSSYFGGLRGRSVSAGVPGRDETRGGPEPPRCRSLSELSGWGGSGTPTGGSRWSTPSTMTAGSSTCAGGTRRAPCSRTRPTDGVRLRDLGRWPSTTAEAAALQDKLRLLVDTVGPGPRALGTAAGVDVAYRDGRDRVTAAAVVLDTRTS